MLLRLPRQHSEYENMKVCVYVHTADVVHRSSSCVVCGDTPTITAATLRDYDYAAFTGQVRNVHLALPDMQRWQHMPQQGDLVQRGSASMQIANDAALAVQLLSPEHRISAAALATRMRQSDSTTRPTVLLDVRPEDQFAMCRLPGAVQLVSGM